MKFDDFDWDEGNIEKCRKHGVSSDDIEDLFTRDVLVINDPFDATKERRFRAIGTTAAGRQIFVVFTHRGTFIRPLSAR